MNDEDFRRVNLAVDEGQRLLDKLEPDLHDSAFAGVTCLAFGMLKAIMECPNCRTTEPGKHFMEPCIGYKDTWEWVGCRHCGQFFHMTWPSDAPSEPEKPKRKARKAAVA